MGAGTLLGSGGATAIYAVCQPIGDTIAGLMSLFGAGLCGIISFFLVAACLLGISGILGLFGFGILDIMAGGACGGYLGYFGTFIEQGGNLYDALRICVAGK